MGLVEGCKHQTARRRQRTARGWSLSSALRLHVSPGQAQLIPQSLPVQRTTTHRSPFFLTPGAKNQSRLSLLNDLICA